MFPLSRGAHGAAAGEGVIDPRSYSTSNDIRKGKRLTVILRINETCFMTMNINKFTRDATARRRVETGLAMVRGLGLAAVWDCSRVICEPGQCQ